MRRTLGPVLRILLRAAKFPGRKQCRDRLHMALKIVRLAALLPVCGRERGRLFPVALGALQKQLFFHQGLLLFI